MNNVGGERRNRRELLAALLGIPCLAGCGTWPAAPSWTGEIVGTGIELGHALRDRRFSNTQPEVWDRAEVVIVGGGVAGLSAAWWFDRAGFHDYLLLELEPELGGTSRGGSGRSGPFPWGAHYLPAPQPDNLELIELLREMEIVREFDAQGNPVFAEEALCRDPEERVFCLGSWHEDLWFSEGLTPEDVRHFRRFQAEIDRWIAWRDSAGRRAFAIPVARSSDDAEVQALDRLTIAQWLDELGITSQRVRWLIDYACRDDYGLTLDQTSAWAGIFYFAARVPAAGLPAQPLLSWPEGNGRMTTHLASNLRGRAARHRGVFSISSGKEPGQSIEVLAADGSGRIHGCRAARVVYCGPQFLAPYVIANYGPERTGLAKEFQYGSWLVANLHLRARPEENGFPLCWDNVLYDSPALGYVVSTHQAGVDTGATTFTWYFPNCDPDPREARQRLQQLTWHECCDLAVSDLERAHPDLRPLIERIDVMRWGHAMVQPRPGFVWGPARRRCSEPHQGIHFAHSDLSGIALFEEAFHQGLRAAREVLQSRGM